MIINARFLTQNITGVQRYATELSRELLKLDIYLTLVSPNNIMYNEIAYEFNVTIAGKKT